jgi:hypothetical protein
MAVEPWSNMYHVILGSNTGAVMKRWGIGCARNSDSVWTSLRSNVGNRSENYILSKIGLASFTTLKHIWLGPSGFRGRLTAEAMKCIGGGGSSVAWLGDGELQRRLQIGSENSQVPQYRQSAEAACTGQAVRRSRSKPDRDLGLGSWDRLHSLHEISPAARGSLHRQGDILARNK